jgi:hypothetical protein
MKDFYQTWLDESERIEKVVSEAPRVARGKDLQWVRTRQDFKAIGMREKINGYGKLMRML